jgi:hypothetical protein
MPMFLQDMVVTLAAIGAASLVLRRVFTTVRPAGPEGSKCASCPAHKREAGFAEPQIVKLKVER